ncbi:geranylgeranyl pyrophosphate synthase [Paenibacillus shirakamiensis]|uniref:Geranylgeranyl pyrophosphate synthase n=1 Tax=Paenibacillus shirakamiensis TaxID=1265935 RepID=A0ABS4JHJ4_9BACL|nr:hypothetical protein [Paenibacillus shirakamiensis]MBP2001195.1 geranylgeranyl pyrophosphate synthase [Paenibacillus shirakamiensis]
MIQTPVKYSTQRVDDYLDLLNYAKHMGDLSWQLDLMETLKTLPDLSEEEFRQAAEDLLWRQFDEVNSKMMDLFIQIRKSADETTKQLLLEKMWDLKRERISLSQKIKAKQ